MPVLECSPSLCLTLSSVHRTDKALKGGPVPRLPRPFVQSGAVMYSMFLEKSPFQLGRKAILGLSCQGVPRASLVYLRDHDGRGRSGEESEHLY
ncbi:hypothetical protein NQZ68_013433 [Dissostichus eleginoides]|nr:hypothetical protein NQZ68_013433 [Dissostichus eleginoides]